MNNLCYNTAMDAVIETTIFGQGAHLIGAIDEAGRGPLAGPVVAACIAITHDFDFAQARNLGIDDSKKLAPGTRERLYEEIFLLAENVGIGIASAEEIDAINILNASLLAMRRAVLSLGKRPDMLLVDGINTIPGLISPQITVKGGDSRALSIAAASIIAKVARDRLMLKIDIEYPAYGFAKHKGYGTKQHLERLVKLGPCPEHRKSFRPLNKTGCFLSNKRHTYAISSNNNNDAHCPA